MSPAKRCRKKLEKDLERLKPKSDPRNIGARNWIKAKCAYCLRCEGAA